MQLAADLHASFETRCWVNCKLGTYVGSGSDECLTLMHVLGRAYSLPEIVGHVSVSVCVSFVTALFSFRACHNVMSG